MNKLLIKVNDLNFHVLSRVSILYHYPLFYEFLTQPVAKNEVR